MRGKKKLRFSSFENHLSNIATCTMIRKLNLISSKTNFYAEENKTGKNQLDSLLTKMLHSLCLNPCGILIFSLLSIVLWVKK